MLEKIIKSDAFKIYFWPLLVLYICFFVLYLFLGELEPDTQKEHLFVAIGNILLLLCFWVMIFRHEKIKSKPINKRTKVMLTILTVVIVVTVTGMALSWSLNAIQMMNT